MSTDDTVANVTVAHGKSFEFVFAKCRQWPQRGDHSGAHNSLHERVTPTVSTPQDERGLLWLGPWLVIDVSLN